MRSSHLKIGAGFIVIAVGLVVISFFLYGQKLRGEDLLQQYGQVKEFKFTDQDGMPITLNDLKGNVWIANFLFTRCKGPCPMMASKIASMQKNLPFNVVIVSFSIDPEHDKPKELKAFAKKYSADNLGWRLLTGSEDEIHDMSRNVFFSAVQKVTDSDPANQFIHSTRYALVDKRGFIRGFYDLADPDMIKKLQNDVDTLLLE